VKITIFTSKMFLEGFLKNIWSLRAFLRSDEDAEQVIFFMWPNPKICINWLILQIVSEPALIVIF
jgi:hypothetical protein